MNMSNFAINWLRTYNNGGKTLLLVVKSKEYQEEIKRNIAQAYPEDLVRNTFAESICIFGARVKVVTPSDSLYGLHIDSVIVDDIIPQDTFKLCLIKRQTC